MQYIQRTDATDSTLAIVAPRGTIGVGKREGASRELETARETEGEVGSERANRKLAQLHGFLTIVRDDIYMGWMKG